MTTIWKYKLDKPKQTIRLPRGAKVIHVHEQCEEPTIWVLVDAKQPLTPRTFTVRTTGEEMEPAQCREYLGTAHLHNVIDPVGVVLHVFEEA